MVDSILSPVWVMTYFTQRETNHTALYCHVDAGESERMTFQQGFAAVNGVTLISDLKHVNLMGYRHGRIAPKIKVHATENFAHCSAGDDFCNTFTEVIREEIRKTPPRFIQSDIEDALRQCVYTARDREDSFAKRQTVIPNRPAPPTCLGGNTMLVFRGNGTVSLWTVDTSKAVPGIMPVPVGSRAVGGDTNNPAVFFLDYYFNKIQNSLEHLIPLAVHTCLMAKSDYVEGVQVGIFTPTIFRVLTKKELKSALALSRDIDSFTLDKLRKGGKLP